MKFWRNIISSADKQPGFVTVGQGGRGRQDGGGSGGRRPRPAEGGPGGGRGRRPLRDGRGDHRRPQPGDQGTIFTLINLIIYLKYISDNIFNQLVKVEF